MSSVATSFIYEDLVLRLQAIQQQTIDTVRYIDDQCKDKTNIPKELKSRSLTFNDPYGNQITNRYMDHEVISTVFKNFKQEYVPKYLQKWTQFGRVRQDVISPMSEHELIQCVSDYTDGERFVTYGTIPLAIENKNNVHVRLPPLPVLLADTSTKIKKRIKDVIKLHDIELVIFSSNERTSNEVLPFQPDDTVFSARLYNNDKIILLRCLKAEVNQ